MLLSSCNYKLAGTPEPLPFNSIHVKVRNDSYAPQATESLIGQLSNRLFMQQLKLDPDAATVLDVRIVSFERDQFASSARDTGRAQAFTMRMSADVSLRNKTTNKDYFTNRRVYADVHIFDNPTSGVLGAEYQNMPALTRILAEKICDEVTGIW